MTVRAAAPTAIGLARAVGAASVVLLVACSGDPGVETARAERQPSLGAPSTTVAEEPVRTTGQPVPATVAPDPTPAASGAPITAPLTFAADAVPLSATTIDALGGAANLDSAAAVIAELMADRPPLLVPAGVDDLVGYHVSVDHEPGSADGLHFDRRSLTYAVQTALSVDEVAARAAAAITATGVYEVETTERAVDGRRLLTLTTDQGPADNAPLLEVVVAESAAADGLVEVETSRSSFDADDVAAETAPAQVREVLGEIAPQLDGLEATMTGWTVAVVVADRTRFENVTVEAVTDVGFDQAQAVIDELGWERHDEGDLVISISDDFRSWTVSDRTLDVRVQYDE